MGLRGSARNLRDGSVEVIAEGPDSGLADLERVLAQGPPAALVERVEKSQVPQDRKSTRLNSSHRCISYAVFCLKKKKPHSDYLNSIRHASTALPALLIKVLFRVT